MSRRHWRRAVAANASATAFVTRIYDAYKGENSKGILIDTDAAIRRYFEPSLAALISKDQKDAARRHEVPTLDGDPFIDAQDWDISAVDIAVRDASPDKAVATVSFKNIDQRRRSCSTSSRSRVTGGSPTSPGGGTAARRKHCADYTAIERGQGH